MTDPIVTILPEGNVKTTWRIIGAVVCLTALFTIQWWDIKHSLKDHSVVLGAIERAQSLNIQAEDMVRFGLALEAHNPAIKVPKPVEYMRDGMSSKVYQHGGEQIEQQNKEKDITE